MRILSVGLALAMSAGAASAGDLTELRSYEANDYSAQVYYRVDFGGPQTHARSLGVRFDHERAAAHGAPSLFQARFGEQGLARLAVNGVDLRGAMLSSNQSSGGGFFSSLSVTQWLALGFTAIVFGTVAADAADGSTEEPTVSGTGGT